MQRFWTWMINAFLLGLNTAIITVLLASPAFAESSASSSSVEDQFLSALLASIGGLKGAGVLGVVVILTQLLVKFFDTKWASFVGKWKLILVSLFTLVAGVSGLMVTEHISFFAALIHSSTLATFQVFAHQVLKQITEKEAAPLLSSKPPEA